MHIKKSMAAYKLFLINLIAVLLTVSLISSCKKEITFTQKAKPEVILSAGDSRLQADNIHLVKDTVYVLSTNLVRNTGQVLSIDAGTLIKVRDNIAVYINSGAKIEANGTQDEPIVFTSDALKGKPGRLVSGTAGGDNFWHGITITGTPGISSGNMNFVRIEFAGGYQGITGEAALSINNADRLTTIQNIQVSYSYEIPSFVFSGGTCNASNLISYASYGTDFNIADGYVGGLQNLLAIRHPYFAPKAGSSTSIAGLLISGTETFAVISNLSVIGPDVQTGTSRKYYDTVAVGPFGSSTGSSVAALLVKGGKFHIRNSVFAGFPKAGFYMDERNSAYSLNTDESEFTYSFVECNDPFRAFFLPLNVYQPYTSDDFKEFLLRPVYNNQLLESFETFGFTDPFNYDINPNPIPKAGSPLLTGANFDGTFFSNSFFDKVTYRGAIGTDNWMQGWVNFIPLQTDYNN